MTYDAPPASAPGHPPDAWDRPSLFFLPARLRPAVTMLPGLLGDSLAFLRQTAHVHGDVVCVSPSPRMFLASHPDHVKHVLQDNHLNYCKGSQYAFLKVVLGTGLLAADGDEWRRHRRLVQPAFHRKQQPAVAQAMEEAIGDTLARWDVLAETGEPVNVRDAMVTLTLDILMRGLFGVDLEGEADSLRAAFLEADSHIDLAASLMPVHVPKWIPTPRNRRFRRAMRALDDFIYGVIRSRRAQPTPPDDLLTLLLRASDRESGAALTDRELRDEVIALMHGGYEPLSDTLTWTCHVLSENRAVSQQLEAELTAVLGARQPRATDLGDLPFTAMLVQEVLRLYPPAWAIGRTAIADDRLGEFVVPAGAFVILSPYVLHRDPRWWDDPEVFDPSRFADDEFPARHRFAYVPFAAGARMCVARDLALIEAQLIVASVWQRFRLVPLPGPRIRPVARYGLEPSAPMLMRVARRTAV
jgi:cytochrome P450